MDNATETMPTGEDEAPRKRRRRMMPVEPVEIENEPGEVSDEIKPVTPVPVLLFGAAVVVVGIWAYLPTLAKLVEVWWTTPDYSHGFLVVPMAAFFLWLRRESYPGLNTPNIAISLILLAASVAMRAYGARYYYDFLDGWSFVIWAFAVAFALGGTRLAVWALPALGFLVFMLPLPYKLEVMLSGPLQRIATIISCFVLQLMGYSAFSHGNVIEIGADKLEVAQACSGLRLFMSIIALTYAYIAIIDRPAWEKMILAAATAPVAIIANSIRIIVTGMLYQATTSESVRHFVHDSAGLGMILVAAGLFRLLLWYLTVVVREEEVMDMQSLVKKSDRAGEGVS